MTIKVALRHETSYSFASPVVLHPHTIRLRPAPHSHPAAGALLGVHPTEFPYTLDQRRYLPGLLPSREAGDGGAS